MHQNYIFLLKYIIYNVYRCKTDWKNTLSKIERWLIGYNNDGTSNIKWAKAISNSQMENLKWIKYE